MSDEAISITPTSLPWSGASRAACMGRVDGEMMERIDAAIAVSFGLGNTQLI